MNTQAFKRASMGEESEDQTLYELSPSRRSPTSYNMNGHRDSTFGGKAARNNIFMNAGKGINPISIGQI